MGLTLFAHTFMCAKLFIYLSNDGKIVVSCANDCLFHFHSLILILWLSFICSTDSVARLTSAIIFSSLFSYLLCFYSFSSFSFRDNLQSVRKARTKEHAGRLPFHMDDFFIIQYDICCYNERVQTMKTN